MNTNQKNTNLAAEPRPDPVWKEWAKTADPALLLREHFGRRALCLGNWGLADEFFSYLAGPPGASDPDGRAMLRAFDLAGMEGAAVELADAGAPDFAPTIRAALLRALRATPRPDAPAIVLAHTADLPDADPAGGLLAALPDFADARLLLQVPAPTPAETVALGVRLPLRDEGRLRRLLPLLLGVARLDFAATFRRVEPLWRYPFPNSPALAWMRVRLRWLSPVQDGARSRRQKAQERARAPRTASRAPGRADAPQGPSAAPQSAPAARRPSAPALAAPPGRGGRGARRG